MAKVTRDDVARLAGVSTAVVSYVINNGPRPVAPATRERVKAIIEELGYRPDSMAQAMARRRSNLIGMVLPDARQPFFAELAHAVEQVASEHGKLVLIGNSDYRDAREDHYVREFLGMRVDGLILISQMPSSRVAAEVAADDTTRVVLLHHRSDVADNPAVVTDDSGGARLAVRHLLDHGHAAVVCLGRPVGVLGAGDPVAGRVAGWLDAMAEAGVPTDGLLVDAPFKRTETFGVALELLSRPDRPTAVFCATDDQAIGVLRAARELGLRVPEDLAVAAFDDIKQSAFADPPLTTVRADRDAMARAAVSLALGLEPPAGPGGALRRFPAELVIRRSCGCNPAGS
ncbi:LacI family DNA-binding transcriptional regulator [Kitasatospora sp. MAP5-34]|uniref:LacI family DNA-binding transcriptional regulator n=1 Tax=Kitasatospora sp. MAP5-34 TaxID=3035102 RepID=UPI00247685F4|nr:LacI family DNA-binding transcriptional regulator [Kitasatospora sp. MAP5-34]MDH6577741.1 LacI family transcriptional regulator [Kitasatospora sp. MAP5-34]